MKFIWKFSSCSNLQYTSSVIDSYFKVRFHMLGLYSKSLDCMYDMVTPVSLFQTYGTLSKLKECLRAIDRDDALQLIEAGEQG